jgi:hypothetical protein
MNTVEAILVLIREVDEEKEAKCRAHRCAEACVVLGLTNREQTEQVRQALAIDFYADEFSKELARRGI